MNVNFWGAVPEPPIPRLLVIFCLGFFFQSDRPTQHQETHSMLNKKREGWPILLRGVGLECFP